MNIYLVHTKDKGATDLGYVYVNYSIPNQKPIRKSTKIKISKRDFDANYNRNSISFNASKKNDFVALNNTITELKAVNPFQTPKTSGNFITFCETNIDNIDNGGTRIAYTNVIKKLKKHYPNLSFDQIDDNFLEDYKNALRKEIIFNRNGIPQTLSKGVIKYNFIVIGKYLRLANKKKLSNVSFDLKDLSLEKNTKRPELLSNSDLKKLINYPKKEKYFAETTFGLLQYFGNGLRFSDLYFMKITSFKETHIELQSPKTSDFIRVPYSAMFIRVLYGYVFRHRNTSLSFDIDFILDKATDVMNISVMKNEIIIELKRLAVINNHNFVFGVPIDLHNYNTDFSVIEVNSLKRERTRYGLRLQSVARSQNFDTKKISSHSFRYKFVDSCLAKGISIYDISKALNHKSLAVTELYIKKNFTLQNNIEISNAIDSMHLGFSV